MVDDFLKEKQPIDLDELRKIYKSGNRVRKSMADEFIKIENINKEEVA
jgi:hypothetical protein